MSSSLTTGKAGVGIRNSSANASITRVDLGPLDRTAPAAMTLSSVATWPMPASVDMQWDGAPDDANGTGVVRYQIARNASPLVFTRGGLFTDAAVTASTTYSYSISAMDRHGNWSTALTVPVTTPASSTGESRRLGVKATGSYWGAAGENIDMFSGNLNFTLPLVNPTRRDGSKLTLSLHYNSQNWRSDSNGTWNMGRDIGYGYGWMFTAGYIRPSYKDYWLIDHYTYVDSTGAEYRLDVNESNIWRSTQGIYIRFDPANNQLIFPDGSFWYFFCASQGDEPDSGTIYPTAFYDRNGNYIIAGYASGIGTNLADSSGRISWISDVRANASYGKSYDFVYTSTGLPHLTQINNNVGLGEEYALSYSTSQALKSPFTPNAQFATVDLLTGVNITNLGVPHLFEYGTNQAGELTKVTFPYGGVVEWAYTNFLFGNGKTFREVNSRKLTSQPNGTQLTYGIAATDTGTPLFAHKARTVSDANGRDTRIYTFDDLATSISYGASTAFEQRDTSLTYPVLLHRDDTWTTDIKGNVYLNSSTTTLDPASSGVPKVSRVEIDRDGWGNVTEQRLFDYGVTSPTLKRKYKNTYSYGLGWVGINNLLVKSEIIEGTTTVQTATYDYDTGPAGSCPANSTNLTDVTDITEHDARYSTSLTWRGNVTYVAVLGKAPVCLSYNIGGTVVKSQTVGGIAVDYSVTSASHYTMPSVVTPNSESNLASSSQFNTFLGLSSTTGPNSATAAFTYDSMTRPSTTTSALGAVTNYAYTNAVIAGGSSTLATSTATTNGKWVRTTVDGLGRTVKVERGNGSTVVSIVDTEYGPCACSAVGKVKRVSQPYVTGGTVYWTQYEYDARGRTTKVTPPLNAGYTTYLYVGNTVKVTDPAGRYKIHTVDVMGNLTKVSEKNPAGGSDLDTLYTYNMADKLTQVSMTRGSTTQLRTFGYDSAFRLQTETKPETGTTTYTYDSMGRPSTKVDAKNQKV
ncbi:RHS repeat domain-containing protein, partial [Paludibaculum fermentans]|uniref:RHS repeat domain-containing protein n=1 Tax=Paludibaculum fermentans TaxID=1473598 RepID=UPI003EB82F79